MKRAASGFSLIELLVALAIIGILTAIALPSYQDYVARARLAEAFSGLSGIQPAAEQHWSNTRSFVGLDNRAVPGQTPRIPINTANFTFAVSEATASAYTVTATGVGKMAGFVFSINQSGARVTSGVPSGWTTNANCWVDRKSGECSQ